MVWHAWGMPQPRYPSDLGDAEWAPLEPLLPFWSIASPVGAPRLPPRSAGNLPAGVTLSIRLVQQDGCGTGDVERVSCPTHGDAYEHIAEISVRAAQPARLIAHYQA